MEGAGRAGWVCQGGHKIAGTGVKETVVPFGRLRPRQPGTQSRVLLGQGKQVSLEKILFIHP
jgi:hypothetical protein